MSSEQESRKLKSKFWAYLVFVSSVSSEEEISYFAIFNVTAPLLFIFDTNKPVSTET